jgi:hypothetical protein
MQKKYFLIHPFAREAPLRVIFKTKSTSCEVLFVLEAC